MDIRESEGTYTIEQMTQMATVAATADGLEINGNIFKITALCACSDMVLFACEQFRMLEKKLSEANQ